MQEKKSFRPIRLPQDSFEQGAKNVKMLKCGVLEKKRGQRQRPGDNNTLFKLRICYFRVLSITSNPENVGLKLKGNHQSLKNPNRYNREKIRR